MTTLPSDLALGSPPTTEDLDTPNWMNGDRRAEWAMRRIAELNEKRDVLCQRRDEWMEQISAWCDEETVPLINEAIRLEKLLVGYAVSERARDDRKTIKLPSGTLSTVGGGDPVVVITDGKAVLAWAQADPVLREALVRPKEVLVSDLRKLANVRVTEDGDRYVTTYDGELIPGVTVVDPPVQAHIRPR